VITSSAGWYATCDASLLIGTAAPPTGTRCPASGTLASGESVFYKRNGTSQTLNSVGNVYIWVGSTNVCTIAVTFVA
jgi:hypothetical protein